MKVTEKAQSVVNTKVVYIKANNSYQIPLEWPRDENGNKTVSDCDYTQQGKKINVRMERDLVFDKNCRQALNTEDQDDARFLAKVKDWVENSGDPRIVQCGVEIQESENAEPLPFPRYDSLKISTILEIISSMLDDIGDSPEDRNNLLESVARYELQRTFPADHVKAGQLNPRKGILDGLDKLGQEVGYEDGSAEVEE